MILTMAFVAPYADADDEPSQALRQLMLGSGTLVCPPRITKPAMEILVSVSELYAQNVINW